MYSYTTVARMKAFRLSSSGLSFIGFSSMHQRVLDYRPRYHVAPEGSSQAGQVAPVGDRDVLRDNDAVKKDVPDDRFPERGGADHPQDRHRHVFRYEEHEQAVSDAA